MIIILAISFIILIFSGIPIALSLGIASWISLVIDGSYPLEMIAHKMVNGINSFPLVAVPLFILVGSLASKTSIADRLVKLSNALVGHIRGGLGHVNVLASMFFGGISGAAVADTASIGSLLIPSMEKEGYSPEDAAAVTVCSSTIGILIPPSIPMVIYGVTIGVSIGKLFIGGLIPGILVGLLQMVSVYLVSKKKNYVSRQKRASFSELWLSFKQSFLSLLLPLFLLASISFGITTATEAGVIGVVYILFLCGLIYKELSFKELFQMLIESAINTAIPLFLVSTASVTAWLISIERVPNMLVNSLTSLNLHPIILMIAINIFLLIIGMFMDLIPALILFAPILLPLALEIGITPIQFGVIMVVNLGIGLVTPPVGNCLFLGCSIAKVDISRMVKAILPYLVVNIIVLILTTYIPSISTYLPSLIYGN
ncbi:MAG: TRAP transporter large permease [Atribacterota bacterium]|nr:TRAP transporter large permease [Atribacterota bacterium]MDD4896067.1 TRAP transporter large permease [Atribacterota bacterium]MDD5636911.1 TRAP transporter large permease [Atribacterota bacterium]